MAKHQINKTETELANGTTLGKQVAQTVTIEDNILPSPQELAKYQSIDPQIVEYFLTSAKEEQSHRHDMDRAKIETVQKSDRRKVRMNWWGMFFAFLSLVTMMGLAAYSLYLDHPWFATAFGGSAVIGIVSVFINAGKK